MQQKTRAHLFINGRVQGVYFRAFTRDSAVLLGLAGWVRNLYDGRVEVLFEGDKPAIIEVIKGCHLGPQGAKVDNIEVTWEAYKGELKGFEILY